MSLSQVKGGQSVNKKRLMSSQICLSLPLVLGMILPLAAQSSEDVQADSRHHTGRSHEMVIVLYDGPLSHDQNWIVKSGPRGPQNLISPRRGGVCSMVPANVSNVAGFERVVFTAERQNLGLWKMSWADTVSGKASDGNRYTYKQQFDYLGVTTDGHRPRPSRGMPTDEGGGFLQMVPDNVATDSLDFDDIFLLVMPSGDIAASSHIRGVFRQQIPPVALDPPPPAFPNLLLGRYIFSVRTALSGEAGCDAL
jgi:hypothetical protein